MIGVLTRVVDTVVATLATKVASVLLARMEPLVVELVERHLGERLGGAGGGGASCEAPAGPATEPVHGSSDAISEEDVTVDTLGTPTLRSSGVVSAPVLQVAAWEGKS